MQITDVEIRNHLQVASITCPLVETYVFSNSLAEWRLSYGIRSDDPDIYFMAIYPAFCHIAKASFHYPDLASLTAALNTTLQVVTAAASDRADALATLFALSRGKESFELFQEQKDLMLLGLQSFYLDNFYQDKIKSICGSYFQNKMLFGITPDLQLVFNRPVEAL